MIKNPSSCICVMFASTRMCVRDSGSMRNNAAVNP